MTIYMHENDLPEGLVFEGSLAVDTETLGLSLVRDPLCLVQLSAGDGDAHLVQLDRSKYDCPNLKAVLTNSDLEKIFHFARFDLAILTRYLGLWATPVFCTKIASKLVRTYTDRHGLKDLARELLGKEISKQQQCSDWGKQTLTEEQKKYAASDVLYLHAIREILVEKLKREKRLEIAKSCFSFLPSRALLDLSGWSETDIFAHHG